MSCEGGGNIARVSREDTKAASVVCAALCTHDVSVTVNYVLGLIINHTAIYLSQLITRTSVTTVQYVAPFCSCNTTN